MKKEQSLGLGIVIASSLLLSGGVIADTINDTNNGQIKSGQISEVIKSDNIASGIFGSSSWYISDNGELHIGAGTWDPINQESDIPWDAMRDKITKVIFDGQVTAGESISYAFSDLKNATSIDNLDQLNTSNVKKMNHLFDASYRLSSLDVSHFNTTNTKDMSYMFHGLFSLTSLDLSNFDTVNVTNMSYMLSGITKITTLDLSNINTSNVTDMSGLFCDDYALSKIDLSTFDTSKTIDMNRMFLGVGLTQLDVTGFDTSNVKSMNGMFAESEKLVQIDVSHFDTSKVEDMMNMFANTASISELDVSHFDTSKVKVMSAMFRQMKSITKLNLSTFNTSSLIYGGAVSMFSECDNLEELDLSSFDTHQSTLLGERPREYFYGSNKLSKLTLGKNFEFTTKQDTGNDGLRDVESPLFWLDQDKKVLNSTRDLVTYHNVQKKNNTYQIGRLLNVQYLDESGKQLANSKSMNEYIGATYDVTTSEYQLNIPGYSVKEIPENAIGILTKETGPVTYVYVKNPDVGADVTVKYTDEQGSEISSSQSISGNVGDAYDVSGSQYKLDIPRYTFKEIQGNATGTFKDQAQTVTYIYSREDTIDDVTPPSSSKDVGEPNSPENLTDINPVKKDNSKNSDKEADLEKIETENKLPETGERNLSSISAMITGLGIILISVLMGKKQFKK